MHCYQFTNNASYSKTNLSLKDLIKFMAGHHLHVITAFQEYERLADNIRHVCAPCDIMMSSSSQKTQLKQNLLRKMLR